MESTVISVRIKKDVKSVLEKDGVDVESDVKKYLNEKAARIKFRKAMSKIHKIIENEVKPSPAGSAAKWIREDRDAGH